MRLIWNASPTRPSQENYYIAAENAGADPMGELAKTGKSVSISRGLREQDWKMREYIAWAKYLWLENAGADLISRID